MRRIGTTVACLLFLGGFVAAVGAITDNADTGISTPPDGSSETQDPYSAIWMRNVFDLKPPERVKNPNDDKPPAPPPNIKLEGITTIFGKKQALFQVQAPQTPGKAPNKEESYMLSEGERRGPLEVLEINPKSRNVKIRNDGIESTITFETNHAPAGVAGPGGAQVAAPPGTPQPPQRGFGRPGGPGIPLPINRPIRSAVEGQQNGYYPGSTATLTPQAVYNGGGVGYSGGYAGGAAPAVNSGGGVNLGSLFNAPNTSTQNEAAQPLPTTTAEEQAVMLMADRAAHAGQNYPPPFPGLPDANAPAEGASQNTSQMPPLPSMPAFPGQHNTTH